MREVHDSDELGRAIRESRRARGWTQSELASWLGVTRYTVIRLERGDPVSTTVAVMALALLGAKLVVMPKDTVVQIKEPG